MRRRDAIDAPRAEGETAKDRRQNLRKDKCAVLSLRR